MLKSRLSQQIQRAALHFREPPMGAIRVWPMMFDMCVWSCLLYIYICIDSVHIDIYMCMLYVFVCVHHIFYVFLLLYIGKDVKSISKSCRISVLPASPDDVSQRCFWTLSSWHDCVGSSWFPMFCGFLMEIGGGWGVCLLGFIPTVVPPVCPVGDDEDLTVISWG